MKKPERESGEDSAGVLTREDWDFSGVPDHELAGCFWWEYARESAFIRETLRNYRQWFLGGGTRDKAGDALFERMEKIQSIGDAAMVVVRGCAFRPGLIYQSENSAAENYRHPEAPPITGNFPDPWQSLLPGERDYRSRIAKYGTSISLPPLERGDYHEADDIAKYCRSKQDQALSSFDKIRRQNPGKSEVQMIAEGKLIPYEEILPSLFWKSGREVTILRIAWADYTNDQLARAFRQWVKAHRPNRIPVPSNKGRKPNDVRAQLTRLAAMRLLSRFTPAKILDQRNEDIRAILETKSFSGRKWFDSTKWHDARREAGRLFRDLFPFLPATEKPRSWERQLPGK